MELSTGSPMRDCPGVLGFFLLSFDLSDETFSEMDLPQSLATDSYLSLAVVKLGEWLSIVNNESTSALPMTGRSCTIWIMKQYGVAESWTKLCEINLPNRLDMVLRLMTSGELLLAKKLGWLYNTSFEDVSELVLYHPASEKTRELRISSACGSFHLAPYIESLALLGHKSAKDGQEGEDSQEETVGDVAH